MRHLVLVGLPGSGKTTVGRAAAALAQLPFLDFDEEIERRTGLSPKEFFQERGQPAFRAEELALSLELARQQTELARHHTIVVAPGGGWITHEASREALRPHARLVYMAVSPATAAARLAGSAQIRPLIAGGNAEANLSELLAKRKPLYESADDSFDTEAIDIQRLTMMIAKLARRCQKGSG